jgi:hypothetical protein
MTNIREYIMSNMLFTRLEFLVDTHRDKEVVG